jgi:hypothetical protein
MHQNSEFGIQKSEVGNQKSEARIQKPEVKIHKRPGLRRWGGAVALTALMLLAGCRGERKAPVAEVRNPLPVEAERPAEGFQAVTEDFLTTGTRVHLRWVGRI